MSVSLRNLMSYGCSSAISYDESSATCHILLQRQALKERFSEELERWDMSPTEHPPHPLSLLLEMLKALTEHLGAFKATFEDQALAYNYGLIQRKLPLNSSHTLRVDRLTELLNNNDEIYQEWFWPDLTVNFSTKGKHQLRFITSGDFFEKAKNDIHTEERIIITEVEGFRFSQPAHNQSFSDVLTYKTKILKTQTNHTLLFSNFSLREVQFKMASRLRELVSHFDEGPDIGALLTRPFDIHERVPIYVCPITNAHYVCSCFRASQDNWEKHMTPYIANTGWSYLDGCCHVCTSTVPEKRQFDRSSYESTFNATYHPWLIHRHYLYSRANPQVRNDELYDKFEEINDAFRTEVDWGRWHNEKFLFALLRKHYGDDVPIRYQARPTFLKPQSYDIYFPEHKIAVEYDGEQHYNPDSYFAKKSSFAEIQQRDQRKNSISKENGVVLFRVRRGYSLESLLKKIDAHLRDR